MINIINIKSYIINLEKYKNNYDLCLKKLNKINIKPERFNAIYVEDENSEEIKKITYPSVQYIIKNGRNAHNNIGTKGAIGCYLSHITLWKMLLDSDEQMFLIFEDDVDINNIYDFNNKINKTINLINKNDWDVIYVGYFDNFKNSLKQNKYYKKIENIIYGTHAYIINRNGAEKLLQKALPIVDQIDSYMSFMALENNINSYQTSDIFFTQNNTSGTTIQTDNSIKIFITQFNNKTLTNIFILISLLFIFLLYLSFIKK
jgi:GR25 family glycosyltransferase involved in LPS biosynthesis